MSRILHFPILNKDFIFSGGKSGYGFGIHTDGETDKTPISEALKANGLYECPTDEASVIISYGGDGTMLGAGRKFSGRHILPIRRAEDVGYCEKHEPKNLLKSLFYIGPGQGLTLHLLPRIIAEQIDLDGKVHHLGYALNDVTVRQADITMAVRYRMIFSKDDPSGYDTDEIVGDGIVIATPFGSSGYYRSITKSVIRSGIGLAFNNSTESVDHQVLSEYSTFEFVSSRGDCVLILDNDHPVLVKEGSRLRFSLTSKDEHIHAVHGIKILALDSLVCRECWDVKRNKPAGFRHV